MDPSQKLLVDEIEKRLAAHFNRLERQFESLERKVDADQKCVIPLPPPGVTPAPTPTQLLLAGRAASASTPTTPSSTPRWDSLSRCRSSRTPYRTSSPLRVRCSGLLYARLCSADRGELLCICPCFCNRGVHTGARFGFTNRGKPIRVADRGVLLHGRFDFVDRGFCFEFEAAVRDFEPASGRCNPVRYSCSASAVVNLAPTDAMERSSKEHLLAASLQANIRAYTPDVGTGYFTIDLRSSCRIVLPAGRYSCWCDMDIHRLERGALKVENRGWIRAVLDPMPSSPPTLLQAPKTSTANLELTLGATSIAATRSDFSVAPRLVNRGASATCSTKCQGGVVNVVAPVAASAVAMALFIISTRVADTSTAIDAVCSIVTFDADSGGVVSTSLFIARMPGAPVLFGRSSDVAVEQSWLLFSSAWIDRQLWPPPHVQAKFEYGSADIRPGPWPSFLLRNHGAMGSVVSSDPPWPLQSREDIRCVPATVLLEFLTCMMISASIVAWADSQASTAEVWWKSLVFLA